MFFRSRDITPLLVGDLSHIDENRDSPERDMVNPSTDSYMWPIRYTP